MTSFRVTIMVVMSLAVISDVFAEVWVQRMDGPCSLPVLSRSEIEKKTERCLVISTGRWTTSKFLCLAEKFQENDILEVGYGIRVYRQAINRTGKTVYNPWSIAFFDKNGDFLGGTCNNLSCPETEGEDRFHTSAKLFLPLDVLKRVASYRLTYYESDQPISVERPPLRKAKLFPLKRASLSPEWRVLWTGVHDGLAQSIEGDCLLQHGTRETQSDDDDDYSRAGFGVRFGGKARLVGGCRFSLESEEGWPWSIQSTDRVTNPTQAPVYFQFFVAFFDESRNLVGCLNRSYSAGLGVKDTMPTSAGLRPGDSDGTHCGKLETILPDAFYRTITRYKLTYYESAVPFGKE